MARDFLGRGWAFDLQIEGDRTIIPLGIGVDIDGEITMSTHEQNIKESIWIILNTAPGERMMRPDFGCGIHNYAFSTVDTATRTLIETSIKEALTLYEPRIRLTEVKTSTENIDKGALTISIQYTVRDTDNRFNLVYPFYIAGERK